MKPNHSNNIAFPISKMNITFNNVSGLLSNYTMRDLYVMSRRNGSQQTFEEFSGKVRNGASSDADDIASLGSLVVIQYNNFHKHSNAAAAAVSTTGFNECEFAILANHAGILINDKGSSSVMSGLLTKTAVLEAKSSGKSVVDYEEIQQLT
jgi:hypothetical protein